MTIYSHFNQSLQLPPSHFKSPRQLRGESWSADTQANWWTESTTLLCHC